MPTFPAPQCSASAARSKDIFKGISYVSLAGKTRVQSILFGNVGQPGMDKYMQSTQSIVWGRASAWAGRAQRAIVDIAVVEILALVVWAAIRDPHSVPEVFLFATIPVSLTILAADWWGSPQFWEAWDSEDQRLGVHSPINALDHFIVQPLDRRIKRSKKREHANPKRDLFIPKELSQRGAIGRDINIHRTANPPRSRGGAPRKKDGGGSNSDGGGKGDGEPQHPHQIPACAPDQQSFFSFQSAARILDCSPKTLRNKVSAGKIPAPIQTAVGPRFTADSLHAIIHPPISVVAPPARPRGRPRISASHGKGGAA